MIRDDVKIVFGVQGSLHLVQSQSISFPIVFPSCLMKTKKIFVNSILFLKNKKSHKIFFEQTDCPRGSFGNPVLKSQLPLSM